MAAWLYQDQVQAGGLERSLSLRSQRQIIELMDLIVTSAAESPIVMQDILGVSQKILTCFYKVVERSESTQLRGKYVDCISKMFRVKPNIFNIGIYAEMLSINF